MIIRDSNGKREGPRNNIFSPSNVKIHGNEIVLQIKNGKCSEISLEEKYNLYECEIEIPFLPKEIIFGFFIYEDDQNEFDIEFGRWNKIFNKNCQIVNQYPYEIERFWAFKKNNKLSIQIEDNWIKLKVNNKEKIFPIYSNHKIGKLHINLWTCKEPKNCQIKIKNLKYS